MVYPEYTNLYCRTMFNLRLLSCILFVLLPVKSIEFFRKDYTLKFIENAHFKQTKNISPAKWKSQLFDDYIGKYYGSVFCPCDQNSVNLTSKINFINSLPQKSYCSSVNCSGNGWIATFRCKNKVGAFSIAYQKIDDDAITSFWPNENISLEIEIGQPYNSFQTSDLEKLIIGFNYHYTSMQYYDIIVIQNNSFTLTYNINTSLAKDTKYDAWIYDKLGAITELETQISETNNFTDFAKYFRLYYVDQTENSCSNSSNPNTILVTKITMSKSYKRGIALWVIPVLSIGFLLALCSVCIFGLIKVCKYEYNEKSSYEELL